MKEFDKYSSAFAFGLVESGYTTGDKLVLWVDQNDSAEQLVAQMGAAKAGVTLVTFDEKEDCDALHSVLKDSGARGLLYSSSAHVDANKATRQSFLQKLMPELHSLYPGDGLNLKSYPMLKQLI